MPDPKKPKKVKNGTKPTNDFTKQPVSTLKRPGGGSAITVLHPTKTDKKKKK